MAVTGADIAECKGKLAEAGTDDAGFECFSCLCLNCPAEAKTSPGKPFGFAINACCRAQCNCPLPAKEAGPDAPASDAPMSSDATEGGATETDADHEGG
jgi:hypothetical protein